MIAIGRLRPEKMRLTHGRHFSARTMALAMFDALLGAKIAPAQPAGSRAIALEQIQVTLPTIPAAAPARTVWTPIATGAISRIDPSQEERVRGKTLSPGLARFLKTST